MFRVLDLAPDGPPIVTDGKDARVEPPPAGTIRWIDLEGQDEPQLRFLQERFGFHPLTIEDCAHFDQRAKLEEYGDYLFIVTHGLETIVVIPLVAVLGAQWGVTGAAVAVLVSTIVFAAAWAVAIARLRVTMGADPTRLAGGTAP